MRAMSEPKKQGAACSEHAAPQENSGNPDRKTKSSTYYATGATSAKEVYAHVLRAANALFVPSQVVELRVLYKNGRVDSGYFDDFSVLAHEAVKIDARTEVAGIYWTLNPVNPDCLHRAKNRVREWASKSKGGATTSDREIVERKLILVDIDGANRPAGISATNAEVKSAKSTACNVAKFLLKRGWGSPIVAMSGNGYHLLYRVALPNDDASANLIKKLLQSLSTIFDSDTVHVDTSVYNASRIVKVYGTIAKKGDNTPERPHRRSFLLADMGNGLDNAGAD